MHDKLQHEALWFPDRSMILSAASPSPETLVLSRVHSSRVARKSTVFRDMLDVADSPDGEKYEGLPLVVMPDTFEDVETLLRALYDRW